VSQLDGFTDQVDDIDAGFDFVDGGHWCADYTLTAFTQKSFDLM